MKNRTFFNDRSQKSNIFAVIAIPAMLALLWLFKIYSWITPVIAQYLLENRKLSFWKEIYNPNKNTIKKTYK